MASVIVHCPPVVSLLKFIVMDRIRKDMPSFIAVTTIAYSSSLILMKPTNSVLQSKSP